MLFSDQGTENLADITKHVCRLLQIPQSFTPSFAHHCLGTLERTHRDLANRLFPYTNEVKNNWDQFVASAVFSMNTSVHSALKCTPFELVHGQRAAFPLSTPQNTPNIETIPSDDQSYLKQLSKRLDFIREQAKINMEETQDNMCQVANKHINPLKLIKNDFVYMRNHFSGKGSKLHSRYDGPYIVTDVLSQHLINLSDPSGVKKFDHPIHVNRLKRAHLRANLPTDHIFTPNETQPMANNSQDNATSSQDEQNKPNLRRSDRLKNKTATDYSLFDFDFSSDSNEVRKIKRILGRRVHGNVTFYLVQFRGEPSSNSLWMPYSQLDKKSRASVTNLPPPLLQM